MLRFKRLWTPALVVIIWDLLARGSGASSIQQAAVPSAVEHPTLQIGSTLPRFTLIGVDGKMHSSEDYRGSPVLVVMFISNHCPTSQLYEARLQRLSERYARKGVAFVAIQANGPKAVAASELGFTDVDDSYDSMVIRASFRKFSFDYLYDGDRQAVAEAFGPKATPHIFIFDRDRRLRFEGRVDNHLQEAKATTHDTREAIDDLLAIRSVRVAHTPVFGCSIKWNSRIQSAQREIKEWQALPVKVDAIALPGLKALRTASTGKLTMINFWATWCGPCRSEYPELLTTYQWYRARGLDFISVSVDAPKARPQVQRFLEQVHSSTQNFQVNSDDLYAVQSAFDSSWESGVPFTVVLGLGGRVVFRQEGEVDILQLRRTLLANMENDGYDGIAEYWKR